MTLPRVIYISHYAKPGYFQPETFSSAPGGENEIEWLKPMLKKAGILDQIDFSGVRLTHGDSLPSLEDADAFIIGGSHHHLSEGLPFQKALMDWLKEARSTNKPIFGICGGHQMMCSLLGSEVADIETGVVGGSFPVDLTEAGKGHFLFKDITPDPRFHFGNYQHAVQPPETSTVLATRPEMPAAALDHGNNWVSVQFHPEADRDVFALNWLEKHPEKMTNYKPLPLAPLMLRNFLQASLNIGKTETSTEGAAH